MSEQQLLLRLWLRVMRAVAPALLINFFEWAFDAVGSVHLPHVVPTLSDHLWMVMAFALRPFSRTPGHFNRRFLARAMRIDPPQYGIEVRWISTCAVNEGKNVLRATLWLPKGQPGPFPTLVLRSPYGAQDANSEWGQMFLAERGYAVLLQDTRGRFGSEGDFVPVEHEKEDGAATVRWARQQSWCDGRVGVIGPSYLGFTAWACVGACDEGELHAAVPTITQSVVRPAVFAPGGAISLELLVLWFYLIEVITLLKSPLKLCHNVLDCVYRRRLHHAFMHTPLAGLDRYLVGRDWDFFQGGVREPHGDDGPFWAARSTLCELRPGHPECVKPPPTFVVTGLHDFFAEQALVDFTRLAQLQPATKLIVAPFSHWDFVSLAGWQVIIHTTLLCVREHMPITDGKGPAKHPYPVGVGRSPPPPWEWLTPDRSPTELALPVQVCFLGSLRWRAFPTWPPPPAHTTTFWLTSKHALRPDPTHNSSAATAASSASSASFPDVLPTLVEYTYTPSAPTPTAGGPSFNPFNAGGRSQRFIERRDDVLIFTTERLEAPLTLAGAATLQLRVWASSRSVDIVGRLCRVDKHGIATNVCEGLTRVDATPSEPRVGGAPPDGALSTPPPATRMQSWKARALSHFPTHPAAPWAKASSADTSAASAAPAPAAVDGGPGRLVTVVMSPLAVELAPGEQLRLQVCSAAHPRWMRNLLADPEVPLHAQLPGAPTCKVQLAVDARESCITLPVIY